jgi:hypothetical protein
MLENKDTKVDTYINRITEDIDYLMSGEARMKSMDHNEM